MRAAAASLACLVGGGRKKQAPAADTRAASAAQPRAKEGERRLFDVFLSHVQAEAGDTVHGIAAALETRGYLAWRDNSYQGELNLDAMKAGVLGSTVFCHVLTDSVPKSWATCWELANAVSPANSTQPGKRIVVLRETDPAKGGSASVASLIQGIFDKISSDDT